MKKIFLSTVIILFLVSCLTAVKFPTSSVTPAAEIIASKKKDKNNNYNLSIKTNHLASPERLSPQKKTYVVWIVTEENGIKNIGQLVNKNAERSTLETISPFDPIEIFITAEDDGTISHPLGIEISRMAFKK